MNLKYGKIAQLAPIDKLSVVIAVILSIVILGEKINLINGLGVAFIAIGSLIVALS